jgi:hypothetical protein
MGIDKLKKDVKIIISKIQKEDKNLKKYIYLNYEKCYYMSSIIFFIILRW